MLAVIHDCAILKCFALFASAQILLIKRLLFGRPLHHPPRQESNFGLHKAQKFRLTKWVAVVWHWSDSSQTGFLPFYPAAHFSSILALIRSDSCGSVRLLMDWPTQRLLIDLIRHMSIQSVSSREISRDWSSLPPAPGSGERRE
jgi:hypothetical protein